MAEVQQQSGLDKRVPWVFFMDTFAQQLGIAVTLQFMNMFMTSYMMITPLVAGSILLIGRIVDMLVSTVSGSIVQKGNLKTGPFRTYILINGPLLALGNLFIFLNPNISPQMKLVVFVIGYFFRNIPQSFMITASNSLVPKVAGSNLKDRLALTSKKAQGVQTAAIFTSMATIPLIKFFDGFAGDGRGYLLTGLLYCAVQTVIGILVYQQLAPYDKYDANLKKVEGSSANVKVTHMYGDTLKNPQVWIIMIAVLLAQIAMFTLTSMNSYYYTYVLGNRDLMAVTTSAAAIAALGVAIVTPPFARKLGKKNTYIISNILMAFGYLIIIMFAKGSFPIFMVCTVFIRMAQVFQTTVGINIWIDAAEYQLYKTGRDSRPFITSLQSLMMKIGQLISSYTFAWVLTYSNYEALGGGEANIDIDKVHNSLFGFLMVCYALAAVLFMIFGINEQKSKEYAEANKKMMEERAAAALAASAEKPSS